MVDGSPKVLKLAAHSAIGAPLARISLTCGTINSIEWKSAHGAEQVLDAGVEFAKPGWIVAQLRLYFFASIESDRVGDVHLSGITAAIRLFEFPDPLFGEKFFECRLSTGAVILAAASAALGPPVKDDVDGGAD
jgi:hypothetical protein